MADFPACNVQGKLKEIFSRIREVGVPAKATYKWLESLGYKSKNDRTILPVLKFIHFVDKSGTPTQHWLDYRGKDYKGVMAKAVKQGYSELFGMYPNACSQSNDNLEHFFSTKTTAGKQVVQKTASTFKTLCDLSDFSATKGKDVPDSSFQGSGNKKVEPPSDANADKAARGARVKNGLEASLPNLHIDVQIHISADSSPEQVEQIFSSMAKHLYKK